MSLSVQNLILALWNGQVPLGQSFWRYAMLYGTLANLFSTILSLAAHSTGASAVLVVALHLLPLPYNIVAGVGVWRSAGHYRGNPIWATMARITVLIWAVAATLA